MISKSQIRFKGPAKRDYISDLNKLRYASSAGRSGKSLFSAYVQYVSIYRRSVMHVSVIGSMRIQLRWATQSLGLRWGFESTSIYFFLPRGHRPYRLRFHVRCRFLEQRRNCHLCPCYDPGPDLELPAGCDGLDQLALPFF